MSEDNHNEDWPLGEYLQLTEPGDRPDALLTGSQREFLYDPTTVSEGSRGTTRQRIRDRLRAGIRDFEYTRGYFEIHDLDILLDGVDPEEKQDILTQALQFFWDLSRANPEADFRTALEDAIRAEKRDEGTLTVRDVSVDIDVDRYEPPDIDELEQKVEEGVRLTDEEIGYLVRLSDDDTLEDVIEHARTPSSRIEDPE